jgi:cell division protein FtsZ
METSIDGARGVLVSIIGSMDMGLDEVENAAGLVQAAAHPDANIIFGAAFDDTMDDEIRVIVIATGFDEGVRPGQGKKAAAKKEEPARQEPDKAPTKPAEEKDPFDDILKIFQ